MKQYRVHIIHNGIDARLTIKVDTEAEAVEVAKQRYLDHYGFPCSEVVGVKAVTVEWVCDYEDKDSKWF